jgi:hypothetical protein
LRSPLRTRIGRTAGQPEPGDGAAFADPDQQPLHLGERRPARLRHEHGQLGRVEDVAVEGDVDVLDAREHRRRFVVDPGRGDELHLRRIEVAGAPERDVGGVDRAAVDHHPQGHPPLVPRRRGLGRVQVAVRVEPDDADPPVPGGEPLDDADMRAAAAAEHEGPLRQVGGDGERLRRQRLLLHDRDLRVGEGQRGGLDHRLAAVAPGVGDADQPGRERPAAGVALVPVVDGHGRVAVTGRASRPQQAHARAFS